MFVLNCKFTQHCHFVWIQIQITFQYSLHWSSGYPQLCSSLLCWFTGASVQRYSDSFSVLRRTHRWRPVMFPLQQWTIIIKLIIKFMNCLQWRLTSHLKMGMKPPLCDHNTSCFGKEQHCFYACSTVFLCQPSCVNWRMSWNSTTLARWGRVRTNFHDLVASEFRQLVTGFPPWWPGFEPGSGHVGFVVDKVALGQVFSKYCAFPCQASFHQLLHNHHHLSSGTGTIGQ
jgi:hypothetical protein